MNRVIPDKGLGPGVFGITLFRLPRRTATNLTHSQFDSSKLYYSERFPPNFPLHRFRHHMPNPSSTDIRARLHISDNWISGLAHSINCQSQHRDLSFKHSMWVTLCIVTESSDERVLKLPCPGLQNLRTSKEGCRIWAFLVLEVTILYTWRSLSVIRGIIGPLSTFGRWHHTNIRLRQTAQPKMYGLVSLP